MRRDEAQAALFDVRAHEIVASGACLFDTAEVAALFAIADQASEGDRLAARELARREDR